MAFWAMNPLGGAFKQNKSRRSRFYFNPTSLSNKLEAGGVEIKKPAKGPATFVLFGVSNGIRTHDPQNHNLVLQPTELYLPFRATKLINFFLLRKKIIYRTKVTLPFLKVSSPL